MSGGREIERGRGHTGNFLFTSAKAFPATPEDTVKELNVEAVSARFSTGADSADAVRESKSVMDEKRIMFCFEDLKMQKYDFENGRKRMCRRETEQRSCEGILEREK